MADRLYSVVFLVFVIITFSQPSWGSLFGICSSVANCTDVNATCKLMGDDMRCVCDDVTQYVHESTCLEKVATGSSCPSSIDDASKPCLDLNAICQNVNTNYRCECKTGYTLSNGDCVKPDCGELQNPSNGAVSISGTGFEATATYTCTTSGYLITGTTSDTITRTCSIGGWSGSLPTCSLKDCEILDDPSNGAVSTSGTGLGATATYTCTNGYLITGTTADTITRTCSIDGWTGSVPTCSLRGCEGLQNPSNGAVSTSGTGLGATATYTCTNGYLITGTSTRTCSNDGWTGSEPTCSFKDCGGLANPSYGTVSTTGTSFGATATYTCINGYFIPGASSDTSTRTCTINGWSGNELTCSKQVSDIPNNLNVDNVQSRSFMVSWTKPTNTYGENMGYIVQVRTVDDACVTELIITCMGCTQSFNPSSFENMCPNGVSITEQRTKTSIDSDDLQTYTVTSLNPYVNYTVTVTAVTFGGRGRIASVTVQTDEEAPQRPKDVTIVDLTPTSCNVTWDIDGPRTGYTTWEVIVDAVLPVTPVSYPLTGFNQRQQVLTVLEEYWEFEVTIRASTSKGRADSDPIQFTTLPAAPGPVQDFDVITSREESKIYVQWKLPSLLQRNGVISSFMLHHNATLNGSTKAVTVLMSEDDSYLYQIELNVTFETVYKIKVYAINTQNEDGVETEITKLVTTKSLERNDEVSESNISVVVAAVIAPCVVVVIVVIAVVLIIRRRRRQTLADQMTLSKIHDDTGRVTENHQTTKKITGITDGMEHEEVMAWMHSNEFIACKKHFKHYTGKDMLELSKDDVARICGAADGIRLFNRMRQRTLADVGPRRVSEGDLNTHYADLDETTRDRVPYENIELNEAHMYSSLN